MKHVGKMKNNSSRLAIVFRTIPGEPNNCLVVGTQGLGDSYHDTLMSLIESDAAQQANELAEVLAVRKFPDGTVMLGYLHSKGHLKKVPTSMVLMTPDSQTQIQLDELNKIIAKQKGVTVDELAINDGSQKKAKPVVEAEIVKEVEDMSPTELRSQADKLFKDAQKLRKRADELDPPKSKKKEVVEAE